MGIVVSTEKELGGMVRVSIPSSRANIYLVHIPRVVKACTGLVGRVGLTRTKRQR